MGAYIILILQTKIFFRKVKTNFKNYWVPFMNQKVYSILSHLIHLTTQICIILHLQMKKLGPLEENEG